MGNTRTKGRVVFPTNPRESLDGAGKLYAKHLADGADSPLNALKDYNWAVTGPTVAKTLAAHDEAVELAGNAEKLFRQRDEAMVDINGIMRSSAALLKGIYPKNPKMLAEWGLQIDDSPKAKKAATPKEK